MLGTVKFFKIQGIEELKWFGHCIETVLDRVVIEDLVLRILSSSSPSIMHVTNASCTMILKIEASLTKRCSVKILVASLNEKDTFRILVLVI